jgi:hypothetical protein
MVEWLADRPVIRHSSQWGSVSIGGDVGEILDVPSLEMRRDRNAFHGGPLQEGVNVGGAEVFLHRAPPVRRVDCGEFVE